MYRIIYNWIILHFIRLGLREKNIFSPKLNDTYSMQLITDQYKTSIFFEMHLTIASI